MTALRFARVSKAYGRARPGAPATSISTSPRGAFVTLVGPSGCGKSTHAEPRRRLRAAHRRRHPPRRRGGQPARPRASARVAMVFQSYALYPHLDVRRNIAFPLEVAGVPRAEIAARVREIAARLEIEPLLDRRPRELSGGQRQRVALGRALVRRTRLCLFDEPLSNLDAALRGHMRVEIEEAPRGDRRDLRLRDPRPGRGHDHVRPDRGPRRRRHPAGRPAATPSTTARQHLRRRLHRRPAHQPRLGRRRCELPGRWLSGATSSPGCGRRTSRSAPAPRPRAPSPRASTSWSRWAPETWVTVEVGGERVVGRAPGDFAARTGEPVWVRCAPERRAPLRRPDAQAGFALSRR